jgi:signal transduction histidine kinase
MQSSRRRTNDTHLAGRLHDHIDQLQQVIYDIRTTIFDLQTDTGPTPRLRTTLHNLITELTTDSPIHTTVRITGPLDVIPPPLAHHAESVVREAVSNAVHHSHADQLTVTISVADELIIDVTDNGTGIPTTVAQSGLHNITHRATDNHGTCTIRPGQHGGTTLTWAVPLPHPDPTG